MNAKRRVPTLLRMCVDKLAPLLTAGALGHIATSGLRGSRARDQMLARRLGRLERGNRRTRQRVVESATESRRRARAANRQRRADASRAAVHRTEMMEAVAGLASQLSEIKAILDNQAKQLERVARSAERDNAELMNNAWVLKSRLQEVTDHLSLQEAKLVEQLLDQHKVMKPMLDGYAQQLTTIRTDLLALESGERGGSLRKRVVSDVAALLTLHDEGSRALLPVPSKWSMTPQVLEYLLRTIRTRDVRTVVELGSGTSTAWLASAVAGRPHARLVCFEHDDHFALLTLQQLEAVELGDAVDMRCRPLAPVDIEGETFLWYQGFEDLSDIDLLIVDGPPGDTGPRARYPALPLLLEKMSVGGVVVLDDANRDDEISIIDRWSGRNGGRAVTLVDSVDRAAVLRVSRDAADRATPGKGASG